MVRAVDGHRRLIVVNGLQQAILLNAHSLLAHAFTHLTISARQTHREKAGPQEGHYIYSYHQISCVPRVYIADGTLWDMAGYSLLVVIFTRLQFELNFDA